MPSARAIESLIVAAFALACADKADGGDGTGGTAGSSIAGVGGTNAQGGTSGTSGISSGGSQPTGGTPASGGAGTSGGGTSSGGSASGTSGGGGLGAAGSGAGASGAAGSDAGSGTGGSGGSSTGGAAGSGANGGSGSGGKGGTAGNAGGGRGGSGGAGGAAMAPFKGVANSPCNVRTSLGVSWYYNWTQSGDTCASGGGEFVPMVWGHTGAEQTANGISSAVTTFVNRGNKNVLAFNEPDNPTQSNIPVNTAISLWPSFNNPQIRIGSPGTAANANPGQAWFTNFMNQLNANSALRADFLAIHWYGWNAGSCDANASQLESYVRWAENFAGNRPIWITEFGCLNQSRPDRATVLAFYRGAIAMFARHPRIERYAWYPWETNLELANSDGSLTELGTAYAAAPAYK